MKHLLKEIVNRITDNLLGKSINGSENGRTSRLTQDGGSHTSQLSPRSSLCNHDDLMDQYKKLLNAVNTEIDEKKDQHRHPSQSNIISQKKPFVYVSDDEQQQQQSHDTSPISSMKRIESTSFTVDHIPSNSTKHHQQLNEEQRHIHGMTKPAIIKKKNSSNKDDMQDYDNLENLTKTKRKTKAEQKVKRNIQKRKKKTNIFLSRKRTIIIKPKKN